jgi:RNA polymerase sigma-70 factor (ECF subfamily)
MHDQAELAEATDWQRIAELYDQLAELVPSPVVELNRAVAIAMVEGPAVGLARLDVLAGDERLAEYPYFHAARADLLRRLGRFSSAADAYRVARELTTNEVERAFLTRRLAEMEAGTASED